MGGTLEGFVLVVEEPEDGVDDAEQEVLGDFGALSLHDLGELLDGHVLSIGIIVGAQLDIHLYLLNYSLH